MTGRQVETRAKSGQGHPALAVLRRPSQRPGWGAAYSPPRSQPRSFRSPRLVDRAMQQACCPAPFPSGGPSCALVRLSWQALSRSLGLRLEVRHLASYDGVAMLRRYVSLSSSKRRSRTCTAPCCFRSGGKGVETTGADKRKDKKTGASRARCHGERMDTVRASDSISCTQNRCFIDSVAIPFFC